MNGEAVGRQTAALRKIRGLTRRELAELAELSQGQLSRLENGRQGFRSETLIRVAEALRVEPYRLFLPGDGEGRPAGGNPSTDGDPSTEGERASTGAELDATAADVRATAADEQALDGALREALRAPDFVSVLEDIARAHRTSPADFVAVRSVMAAVLGR